MLLDPTRLTAIRERRVEPATANHVAAQEIELARERATFDSRYAGWAVHRSQDAMRIVTVEAWHDSHDSQGIGADELSTGSNGLFKHVGTGGRSPTPVEDPEAGVIVIDLIAVLRPLAGLVAAFNLRNGAAFNREPGCISTTVLRGVGTGRIATYARWRSVAEFTAAFSKVTRRVVRDTAGINAAAARMTVGLIRPDYHAYDLIASGGDAG